MTPTEGACAVVRWHRDTDLPDKQVIDLAIAAVLQDLGEGFVDSHALADAIFARHYDPQGVLGDWKQKRDYVQHCLREAKHVCRHADGHHYRVHHAETCSPGCTEKYDLTARKPQTELCGDCFTRKALTGACLCG